ncbi:Uncharacterized protein APZ42_005393, partial [Daphnia magna]
LCRATNTSPGVDGLEYRHLRALDPDCILLKTANFPSSDHLQTVLGSNQPGTHRGRLRSWLVISRAKGFPPGVHGIQEHRQLLQTVVEETSTKRRHVSIAWLDMSNAFGSVPHTVLGELFASLPIPDDLRRILADIYSGNRMDFAVPKESVRISPTAGVCQGDALSAPIFNLASEPLVRAESPISTPDFYYLARSSRPRHMLTTLPWLQILLTSSKIF